MIFRTLLITTPLLCNGCIITTDHRDYVIDSYPESATISVNHVVRGVTPLSIKLRRLNRHTMEITKDGYDPIIKKIDKEPRGDGVLGNIYYTGLFRVLLGKPAKTEPIKLEFDLMYRDK